ncbi:putative serine protease K12H4.7 isoform X1 [Ruditapes philippinarum]|uniref:putative serine protease K12H4.7 isoform X1 n=1 Tax=Ruditapes philippinarum TaxID=129788 RepID=UPI00295BBEFF|nr:putative serine protease K12H4.7 isoform X1 [Ruditapes philippinarum]
MENGRRENWLIFLVILTVQCHTIGAWMFNGRPEGGKVGAPYVPKGVQLPDQQFYEFQKVNHFDGSDFRYWKQRYFVNNVTFRAGGPIFIMLGGESEANPAWLVDGAWQQYARDHGAFLVLLEHRYYGESHPVPDLSTPNLQYLSSKQALADIAQFVTYFKKLYIYQYLQNSSVILFGGSYAGSLAAWARSRYPYLIDGAVASSAPMVAMMEFQDYYVGVGEALDNYNTDCSTEIRNATTRMYDWWGQPDKRVLMQKIFRLCDKIDHNALLDLSVFFNNLASNFAGVVQYNNDNREFLGKQGTDLTIKTVCDIMTDESRGDNIQRYADVNSLILDTFGKECLNLRYNKLANSLNHTEWGSVSAKGSRQWLYQTCSEFGWIQSSWSPKQPFSQWFLFPFNYTTDQCISVFPPFIFGGSEVIDNSEQTNRFYGGLSLPISKAVFVNGMMDPWKNAGLTWPGPYSDVIEIILIEGTAHCADMYPPSSKDPPQLAAARSKISKTIGSWLANN